MRVGKESADTTVFQTGASLLRTKSRAIVGAASTAG